MIYAALQVPQVPGMLYLAAPHFILGFALGKLVAAIIAIDLLFSHGDQLVYSANQPCYYIKNNERAQVLLRSRFR